MRVVRGRLVMVSLVLSASLLVLVVAPGLASSVSLAEVRPGGILIGTTEEVTLVGSGFGANCGAWVRAADIAEHTIPAILRSATQMAVLVGGTLTSVGRTLEFQVRCTHMTVEGTRIDRSEWRPLRVFRPVIFRTPRPPVGRAPAAPSDVRVEIGFLNEPLDIIRWRDNSDNESGFRIHVDGRLVAEALENATSHEWSHSVSPFFCGRIHQVEVKAYRSVGGVTMESSPARATVDLRGRTTNCRRR